MQKVSSHYKNQSPCAVHQIAEVNPAMIAPMIPIAQASSRGEMTAKNKLAICVEVISSKGMGKGYADD